MNTFDSNMKYVMMNTIRKLNIYPLGGLLEAEIKWKFETLST